MADPLEFSLSSTPNPNAVKVTLNRVVAASGKTYRDAASADVEWAKRLLGVPGVTQVFALQQFISVTKRPEANWDLIGPQIEHIVKETFQ